jgi:hypothetical protein
VLILYAFFVTGGDWGTWPESTRYYDELATAFRSGRLHLDIVPPDSFAALSDPHDPQNWRNDPALKEFVDQVWDASYYGGKFYVYWGPAPALLLWVVRLIFPHPIGDQFITYGFAAGLFVLSSILIVRLAGRFFSDVPIYLVLTCILVVGLGSPIPWLLTGSAIYEAAITAGSFFLIAGVYAAFDALDRSSPSLSRLALASTLWAFAVASRWSTIIPVAFLAATTFLWALRKANPPRRAWSVLKFALALSLPIGIGVLGLGCYNWARFGSVLETGYRFQLTFTDLNRADARIYSPLYMLPNLWFYLFNPISIQPEFPFVGIAHDALPSVFHIAQLDMYHLEEVAGLINVIPFVAFSLVPLGRAFFRKVKGRATPPVRSDSAKDALQWLLVSLYGASLLGFLAVLPFFYVTMRYQADFVSPLVLLSAIGVWQGYEDLRGRPTARTVYALLVLLTAAVSIAVSVILPVAVYFRRYRFLNPELFTPIRRYLIR